VYVPTGRPAGGRRIDETDQIVLVFHVHTTRTLNQQAGYVLCSAG
jgi:hypothetical protein